MAATGENAFVEGIKAGTYFGTSPITVHNSGDVHATATGYRALADGIDASAVSDNSPVEVVNRGDLNVRAIGELTQARGIRASGYGVNSPISIHNFGDVHVSATGPGLRSRAIFVGSESAAGVNSPVTIRNAGSVFAEGPSDGILGDVVGITVRTYGAPTTIINTGEIGASSHLAIHFREGSEGTSDIFNAGLITGFVNLTEQRDRFFNQAGGVFETKKTSFFGGGDDFFVNESGGLLRMGDGSKLDFGTGTDLFDNRASGTVQIGTSLTARETASIERLETFRNRGLISMIDGGAGDMFTISNTPGGTDLNYEGGGTLAVDAFLGGPAQSSADLFKIEGNVSGFTTVVVNNTNVGPGTFNPIGFTVVYATGATPDPNAFQLAQPIDTGLFDYDLFFEPRGSGVWEFRSFTGAGAFLLPQLITSAQDIWHQSASTWFDRTADLRVLMAGGMAPTAYDPGGKSLEAAGPYPLTPAVWARGSGGVLDRDDTVRTTAYGRNYTFDLDRELTTLDFQVGVDLGQRDVWSQGDALVFGMLGGFVYGDLDYDAIPRAFDFSGGQVGAYATYLNGGLFVDTLLNVHLYELSTATLGFPSSLDANTVGLRTDTGYRFGSFTGGAFLEPLATIEVLWADIDGFSLGGNRVSFDDDANVRGRLGLRAGTTMQAWEGTLMEPFVIGSVWGNLSDDNSATLVSNGRTFRFQDDLEDVWGEISGGVNFFNFSQTTAVFAKVDVTVGDDISGVGGKAGMRVNW